MQTKFKEEILVKKFFLAVIALIILTSTAAAQSKTLLYVPIDNRPCNLFQVVQVAEKLGYEILTPPGPLNLCDVYISQSLPSNS